MRGVASSVTVCSQRDLLVALVVLVRRDPLIGREDTDVADEGFGGLELGALTAADGLRQDEVDTVAGEDETGDAGRVGDRHRDGAHPGAQRGGEEAAVAGLHQRPLGQRLAGRDIGADDGAGERRRIGRALDVIGVLDEILGPRLIAEAIRLDDRADGQHPRGDQHFGPDRRRDDRRLRGRRRALAEHVLGHHRGHRRDDQRSYQQGNLLRLHDGTPLRPKIQ